MLNARILGLSILKLKKKIAKTANPEEREELETLLAIKKKQQSEEAERYVNSKLFKLATKWLRIQRKAVISTLFNGSKCYDYNTADIFLAMAEIVHTAEKKGIKL